jgi:hypothetical protein
MHHPFGMVILGVELLLSGSHCAIDYFRRSMASFRERASSSTKRVFVMALMIL